MKKILFIIVLLIFAFSYIFLFDGKNVKKKFGFVTPTNINNNNSIHSLLENKHFGVDGIGTKSIWKIAEIGDGASGSNGLSWGGIEPKPPANGIHDYASDAKLRPLLDALNKTGRKFQLNLRLTSDWALERGKIKVKDPTSGKAMGEIIRIKQEHLSDWEDLVKYLVKNYPIDYLQISSEAENVWSKDADGYIEALCIAYKVANEVNPKIKIMAAGFNVGTAFTNPVVNQSWEIQQQLLDDNPAFKRKLTFILNFLENGDECYDILSLHLSDAPETIPPTVKVFREQMQKNGYDKIIWADDMASGPMLSRDDKTEKIILDKMDAGDVETIGWFKREQAKLVIKKPVIAFASGVDKVFISSNIDWANYHLASWRHMGLIDTSGNPKQAFYNYKTLVSKLDGFTKAEKLNENIYKFSFDKKDPVFVLWDDAGSKTIDMNSYISSANVSITHAVTEVKKTNSVSSIDIDEIPIFVEQY